MHPVILFVIKSILVSSILTAWYLLALKNKRLHRYNRFYLLFTLYASIQVPLLRFHWSPTVENPPVLLNAAARVIHVLNGEDAARTVPQDEPAAQLDFQLIALGIMALVSLLLLAGFITRILWVMRQSKRFPAVIVDGVKLVQTALPKAPFSFLGTIYWKDGVPLDTEAGRMILRHELAHARQKHTYDKLACQLLHCVFWMNPFYWIIQKELAMVHEFQADEQAIVHDGTIPQEDYTAAFAKMLLQLHDRPDYFAPEHRFFSSPIKRRLTMLQSNKTVRASLLRRTAVLPLIAGSILLFAFRPQGASKPAGNSASRELVLVVDAGHGGSEAGCRSGSLTEKELTLRVARRMEALAPRYNIKVYLTRKEDKNLTLQERVAFSNNLHPDDFISIHIGDHPGAGMAPATFDIAINTKNAKAEESSRLAYAVLQTTSRPDWIQTNAFSEKNPYVLRESSAASILMEVGNIHSPEQMQHLEDEAKLDALCSRILEGIVEAHR